MSPHTHRRCPLVSHCPKARPALPSLELLSRREWVKRFVLGSAVALGSEWEGSLLADISPGAYAGNIVTFKISDYPALQNDYGSMRFRLFGEATNDGIIIINRAPGTVFYAVSARCTHEGGVVDAHVPDPEDPENRTMICYNHNSVYHFDGKIKQPVVTGQANLPTYQTSFANGLLKVEIPSLNLRINKVMLASVNGNTKRLQLTFPARANGVYKLYYTPDLTFTPVSRNFATSVGGSANVTQITQATNATRQIWVDSTTKRGFYFIELQVDSY